MSGQSRKISRCRASRPTSSQPFSQLAQLSCGPDMPTVGQPVGAASSVVALVLAISSIATAVPMAASSAAAPGQQAAEATSTSMVPNAADEAATEPEVDEEVDEEGGSEVDGPEDPTSVGQSFRLSAAIAGGGYAEFLVDATLPTLQLALTGMGLSDLNLVVIDDELGMLAVGAAPRDRERLTITNEYPRTLRVLVLNGGRNANVFTLSGY
jgi:hypothetical protein